VSDVLFVSWVRHHGRSADLAESLGARAVFVTSSARRSPATAVWRWGVQLLRTLLLLARERPRRLVVMAPPMPLVVLAVLYRRLPGRRVVVDAHTGAVLRVHYGNRPNRALPLLARLTDAVVVTNAPLAEQVRRSGTSVLVLHDPPGQPPPPAAPDGSVLFPCAWAPDEPLADLAETARGLPGTTFVVTGTPRGPGAELVWPDNVTLTGWLSDEDYAARLAACSVVLALTTRDSTMQRAGYEALAAGRPLVASSTQALRTWFTAGTVFAENGAEALTAAVREALERREQLAAEMAGLRALRAEEFDRDLSAVRAALDL
jgi:glycosyltransferase involved in cell wall biosynthesis